jgi:conjugal transfer pilus assembly protein TraB
MSRFENMKNILFRGIDKIRDVFRDYFVADGTSNEEVRKRHIRIGVGLLIGIVGIIIIFWVASEYINSGKLKRSNKHAQNISKANHSVEVSDVVDISNLKNGVSHEQTWMEGAEEQILDLKVQQQLNTDKQTKMEEILEKDTISRKDLLIILEQYKRENDEKFTSLANQAASGQNAISQPQGSSIEVIENKAKIISKKIGSYIPAGSYVEAKMISGVDAGIGMTAEADPRQVLLRITGKLISAGYGKHYLTTDKLMGCVVQCQAVGDLSSEKAYLKPVVMTCAKDKESIMEIPVKGYVSANGKVGIRGEIISREGDLVAKSFLSGLIGGIGSGASQFYEPSSAISNGFAVKTGNESVKNILGTGLGKGINDSSSRLSDYLIKRAEQYQPVISINEGVSVDLVFQEGFSMNEEEDQNGKN